MAVSAATQAEPLIVISASRVEQPLRDVGSTVVVLEPEALRERGVEFVSDALLEVPSLAASSVGPRGSQIQVRARGNEANHVLVLIDGMRIGNASTGEYDLANMSLAGIEKIEVLLGPQSTLYGSDAIAGVISITTKKGAGDPKGNVRLDLGSQQTRSASVHMDGAHKGWHFSATADKYRTDGISAAAEKHGNTEKDGYDTKGIKLKAGYDHERFQTWLVYLADRSRYDFDGEDFVTGLAVDEDDNRQWVDTRALSWVLSIPLLDGRMNNQLQVYSTDYDYESYSVFFGSGSTYESRTDRDAIEYQGSFRLDRDNSLQFGAEYFEEALETAGYVPFDGAVSQQGIYLNWLSTLGALDLSVGARHDDHEEFGGHNTYRLTASYRLNERLRLRATHGTGFKAPSLQELYDTGLGGNPGLRPEESTATELGIEYLSHGLEASLTLFDQDVTDLIRYVGVFPTGVNENVGRAQSKGVEVALGRAWGDLRVDAAVSRTDATETDDGVTMARLRIPEWSANLLTTYYLNRGRLWAQALYRGDRPDRNFATGEIIDLDGYWLFNLGASYDLADNLTLAGRIDNLFDQDYEEVYSYGTRGRTGLVYLDWRF